MTSDSSGRKGNIRVEAETDSAACRKAKAECEAERKDGGFLAYERDHAGEYMHKEEI